MVLRFTNKATQIKVLNLILETPRYSLSWSLLTDTRLSLAVCVSAGKQHLKLQMLRHLAQKKVQGQK